MPLSTIPPAPVVPAPSGIKSIQRGVVNIASGQASGAATIAAVNMAKAEIAYLGGSSFGADSTGMPDIQLTNATTVTGTRIDGFNTGMARASFQVTEWY